MSRIGDMLVMPNELAAALGAEDPFEAVMALDGEVFRDVPGRKTLRVKLGRKHYFIKQHFGVGWREIFKNLLSFRMPVVSALTEWQAIQHVGELGIATTPAVACGRRGISPAGLRSFLVTEDLGDIISLEDFCRDWALNPPPLRLKRQLIIAVAELARKLHDHGLNHRDFYLCHFCLDGRRLARGEIFLYLIDLHRVGIRNRIPPMARMKDIAALYFSALDTGLGARDYLRFLRHYRGLPRRDIIATEHAFWDRVCDRAERLYFKFHRKHVAVPRI